MYVSVFFYFKIIFRISLLFQGFIRRYKIILLLASINRIIRNKFMIECEFLENVYVANACVVQYLTKLNSYHETKCEYIGGP